MIVYNVFLKFIDWVACKTLSRYDDVKKSCPDYFPLKALLHRSKKMVAIVAQNKELISSIKHKVDGFKTFPFT